MALYGRPEIFNSDQGAQFTSTAFTGVLEAAGVRISAYFGENEQSDRSNLNRASGPI